MNNERGIIYSDALNTPVPSANGARGRVPAYDLLDVNATWQLGRHWTLRGSVNNTLNKHYYTKRPTLYPGGGVWPLDGRNAILLVGFH